MTGDFFTKPLQGCSFVKFRDRILNYRKIQSDEGKTVSRSVLDKQDQKDTGPVVPASKKVESPKKDGCINKTLSVTKPIDEWTVVKKKRRKNGTRSSF